MNHIVTRECPCCRNRTCQRHLQRAQAMLRQLTGRMSLAYQQSLRERNPFSSQPDPFCTACAGFLLAHDIIVVWLA